MQNKINKQKNRLRKKSLLALASILIALNLAACGSPVNLIYFAKKDTTPTNADIISGYYRTGLRLSNSADVLDEMYMPQYEFLSQSKTVIAVTGQKKDEYKKWLKMASFDENEPMAQRKYLFIEDEKPKTLFAEPKTNAFFECAMVIDKQMLTKPYSNPSARLLEILKKVQENTKNDLAKVSEDNHTIQVCGGMAKQALTAAITKLESSPAEIAKINTVSGVKFTHLSLDEGVIQMGVEYDIVTVKIKLGSYVKKWKLDLEKEIEEVEADVW
jgi:hypothetical protein